MEHIDRIKLTISVEDTPNGFPRLAAFQSSEANFALYRSFSYLHSRVLLDLQDEITSLEQELDDLDREDEYEDPDRLRSRELDVDRASTQGEERTRRVILQEIRERLKEYGEVLDLWTNGCCLTFHRQDTHPSKNARILPKASRSQLSKRSTLHAQYPAPHGLRNGIHPHQRGYRIFTQWPRVGELRQWRRRSNQKHRWWAEEGVSTEISSITSRSQSGSELLPNSLLINHTEVLPHPRAPSQDFQRVHLLVLIISHRQTRQHNHHDRHLHAPRHSSRSTLPSHKHIGDHAACANERHRCRSCGCNQ